MPAKCCKEFFAKIPDEVPVFTLVGYDKLAQETVAYWLRRAKEEKVHRSKLARALKHLLWMENFESDHPERMKLPD